MKIYISTADQCLPLIKVFSYLFNRFWSTTASVTILGYDAPEFNLPSNFTFVSMGKQTGGIQMWSTDLKIFFESIDDEFFVWATEDQFIMQPVNFFIYNHIIGNYLTDELGRFCLTNDGKLRPFDFCSSQVGFDVIINRPNVDYRLSAMWSIWNRKYLLKYILPGWSPWEFEIYGSNAARNDGYKILATYRDYVIQPCQAIRRGRLDLPLNFNLINDNRTLSQDIIDDMKKKGIIDEKNCINK